MQVTKDNPNYGRKLAASDGDIGQMQAFSFDQSTVLM